MMKKLLFAALLVCALPLAARSQTYPTPTFNSLTLQSPLAVTSGGTGTTTSTGTGAAVLGTSPMLTTPNLGTPSAVTLTNGTGLPVAGIAVTMAPSAASNTVLEGYSTAAFGRAMRTGFAAEGDSPSVLYTASGSACSLNSGAGDGGSQVQSSNGKCWIASFGAGGVDVRDFGAVSGGTASANDTAFAAAIAYMSSIGGGNVIVPFGKFLVDGSALVLPGHVVLQGIQSSPDGGSSPLTNVNASELLVNSYTTNAFIELGGYASGANDLLIYDPNQVAPTAATPTAEPPMIAATYNTSPGGCTVNGNTLVNAYIGIDIGSGRCAGSGNKIGAYSQAIVIDGAQDFVNFNNTMIEPFYDIYLGLTFPQTIDTWVNNHGQGINIGRADGVAFVNTGIFSKYACVVLQDSITSITPKTGYGFFTNTDCDGAAYGVNAVDANSIAGGFKFNGLDVSPNSSGVGTAAQAAILVGAGSTDVPSVQWNGGSMRGGASAWAIGGVGVSITSPGTLYAETVTNLNNFGYLSGAPAVPASGTALRNPYPFPVDIYLSGGTIAAIVLGGTATNTGTLPVFFKLGVNQTITFSYTVAPTWKWFGEQ